MPQLVISIKTSGTEEIIESIEMDKVRMTDFRVPLKKAGNVMLRSIDANFKVGGRPQWQPLSLKYSKWKAAHGYSYLPLTRTGALRRSISFEADSRRLAIGTSIPYGRIHQNGGFAGRGGSAFIPARPYLAFQEEDLEVINKLILDYIKTGN